VSAGLDVHQILDNYGTRKTAIIGNWQAQRPCFQLHFTPTSASWLNLVERWFAALTAIQLWLGHRSIKELKDASSAVINNFCLCVISGKPGENRFFKTMGNKNRFRWFCSVLAITNTRSSI
jgi:hypothetical protein